MRQLPLAALVLSLGLAPAARAEDAEARATCGKVLPAAAVSKAVGQAVTLKGGATLGLVRLCSYDAGRRTIVTLQVSPKLTAAQYQDLYVKTAKGARAPLAGAGDEAFTSTSQTPFGTMTYAVVRKGSAALTLGPAMDPDTGKPLATERQLVELARAAKL